MSNLFYTFDASGICTGTSGTQTPYSTTVAPPSTPLPNGFVWMWTGVMWTQGQPAVLFAPVDNYGTVMTLAAFIALFSAAEQLALTQSPAMVAPLSLLAAMATNGIDMAATATATFVNAAVANSCITAARGATILATPVTQATQFHH